MEAVNVLVWASGYMSLPRCAERSAALVLAESGKPFRSKWQCSASPQLDSHLHGFMDVWYTCRPIIEECRLSFWEPSFAKHLQAYAESLNFRQRGQIVTNVII
jgi:hypothetical protein